MKIKVTLITENDVPLSKTGMSREAAEEKARKGWELVMQFLAASSENNDRATVETVELLED
ncbi:MAG: hypothetical protein IKY92_03745 [Akkermansia sp.]|nr:hypothetical protein [Akkermansia sp.]